MLHHRVTVQSGKKPGLNGNTEHNKFNRTPRAHTDPDREGIHRSQPPDQSRHACAHDLADESQNDKRYDNLGNDQQDRQINLEADGGKENRPENTACNC